MKKNFLIFAILPLLASCGTNIDSSVEESVNSSSTSANEVSIEVSEGASNIITGHGEPSNDLGTLYSLYVDEDTHKIYEKNKAYVPTSPLAMKKFANDDGAKWVDTNCKAGENFNKESPVADVLRTALLSTNVTIKANDHTVVNMGSSNYAMDSVAYIAFNVGNVIFKTDAEGYEGFDNAIIRAYSTYNADTKQFSLFMNEVNGNYQGVNNFVDRTSYLTDEDPSHKAFAERFTKRCFNDYVESACKFALFDEILKELDNFTVTNKVYALDKVISVVSEDYIAMYGEGQLKFSNLEFKLSEDSLSLDYLSFSLVYQTTDETNVISEDMRIEASNLRTTSFNIPE